MQRPFPFHALGYSRNPFGALSDAEWEAVAILPAAVQTALESGLPLQLLGPKGAGKSTTLRKMAALLRDGGTRVAYEYIPEGQNRFYTPLAGLQAFCLDEVQRLRWTERQRLRRSGVRLLLGAHRPLTWRGEGKRPYFLTINLPELITPAHWQAIIARRLTHFALPGQPHLTLTAEAIDLLAQTFGADLREGEYFLYEVWQAYAAKVGRGDWGLEAGDWKLTISHLQHPVSCENDR